MKKITIILCCLLQYVVSFTQEDAWVFFKDKPNAQEYISNPLTMLSQRAIDRRTKQGIALGVQDAPIHNDYYNKIKSSNGISLLAKSKWLNAVHVKGTQAAINSLKQQNSFISKIEFANKSLNQKPSTQKSNKIIKNTNKANTNFNYGTAKNQVSMLNGDYLHTQGYTGEGVIIAVIDDGFLNVNTMSSFARTRTKNKILGGYNFVSRNPNFYTGGAHGTHVLSTIAGYVEGRYVGTAPDASFYLFVTENDVEETPLEESLWVEAAEKSDSLGVDVINTSLGYSVFDKSSYNYTYANMDGKTTFIARGAEIGASKGMVIVIAAGNEGDSSWRHITSPADAAGVLTVGAVDPNRNVTNFSSRGLTPDGRVKPDVMAQGQDAAVIYYDNEEIGASDGTSFSSPIMAGTVACLWQALPNKTSKEIIEEVKKSSDKYTNPNDDYGYGIPNFKTILQVLDVEKIDSDFTIEMYPNPTSSNVYFKNLDYTSKPISIYNILGKKIGDYSLKDNKINISNLSKGVYIMQINNYRPVKLIKN